MHLFWTNFHTSWEGFPSRVQHDPGIELHFHPGHRTVAPSAGLSKPGRNPGHDTREPGTWVSASTDRECECFSYSFRFSFYWMILLPGYSISCVLKYSFRIKSKYLKFEFINTGKGTSFTHRALLPGTTPTVQSFVRCHQWGCLLSSHRLFKYGYRGIDIKVLKWVQHLQ